MAPTCQLQSAHTTLIAAPWSSTLQRHHQPAPERIRHSNSYTLQRAAAPFTSTLAARVGYSTYPLCSTLKHLCSSTSRLARQHPQAAPSTHIRSPACPLQSMAWSTHQSDSSTFKDHPQAPPAAAPWAPPTSRQIRHTTLTASNTLHQHLAAALQRHHDARSKAHVHQSDSSTHSVNSQLQKHSTYGIITNNWNNFGVNLGK